MNLHASARKHYCSTKTTIEKDRFEFFPTTETYPCTHASERDYNGSDLENPGFQNAIKRANIER